MKIMPRHKLYYIVCPDGDWWWIKGYKFPVKRSDCLLKKVSFCNNRHIKTKRKALQVLNRCPKGSICSQILSTKRGHFHLKDWIKW